MLPWCVSFLEGCWRRLRPELVPGLEVVEVLTAVHDPAVLELEDGAAVDVQPLAVSLRDVVMDADRAAVLVGEHALQIGPERAARLGRVAAETGEDGLPSDGVAGERAPAGRVPGDVVAEELGERRQIAPVERLVAAADDRSVLRHDVSVRPRPRTGRRAPSPAACSCARPP